MPDTFADVTHQINLGYNESVNITLPDGRVVNVLLGYLEPGEQEPELDIMLPSTMTANCYEAGLVPSKPCDDPHVMNVKQIVIPLN